MLRTFFVYFLLHLLIPFRGWAQELYHSHELIINKISENAYQHISYLQTEDFGKVACNGVILKNDNEVIILDSPTNDKSSLELINWISQKWGAEIKAVVPTHFHEDCLGGLNEFSKQNIPTYVHYKTLALASEKDIQIPPKVKGFRNLLSLSLGEESVLVKFFGEGHTQDNVIGYFAKEQLLFGGCLIKGIGAKQGFTGDANLKEWATTVTRIKRAFPKLEKVVPGHGDLGGGELLDYTIELFKLTDK
ncbi:MAG: subclass B1 metallo-beta-lactamase [Flavobacteriaceae bacterium]